MKNQDASLVLTGNSFLTELRKIIREELDATRAFGVIPVEAGIDAGSDADQSMAYLNIREAATFSRLASSTIRLYIRTGKIKALKVGRRVIVRKEDLEEFLEGGRAA